MSTLQEINNRIHSIPTPSELESSLSSIKSDIETVLSQPDDGFNENYYKNHTGRELFRKLNNFGLGSLIFDSYDSGFRPTTIDGVSFVFLTADNSNTPSYTFDGVELNSTLKLKISGDFGEFLTIRESIDSINFSLTIGGTESDPTLTLNDGASNFGTLSEGESTTYTLSDGSDLIFLFDSLGSIILHITRSTSEVVQDALLSEGGKVLTTESENPLGF